MIENLNILKILKTIERVAIKSDLINVALYFVRYMQMCLFTFKSYSLVQNLSSKLETSFFGADCKISPKGICATSLYFEVTLNSV